MARCTAGYTAGENIQGWLAGGMRGDDRKVGGTIVANNPIPAIHGRVWHLFCGGRRHWGRRDEAIKIHAVEGDLGARSLGR